MTIQTVFDRLGLIGQAAAHLLDDTCFHSDDGLGECVTHLPDVYEDTFLRDEAAWILKSLEEVSNELHYLQRPCHGEYTLRRLPNERYGYRDKNNVLHTFTCGECLEAKLCDKEGKRHWAASRIEYDGFDYFLVGFHGVPLDGLTVRERR